MSADAVVARGLTKRFGAVSALRGVDLDVAAGRTCVVLGPNGAGKSTLLRILAGLARPTSGSLELLGQDRRGGSARALVGFVGHATLLYPELSARENLVFAGRLYGVSAVGDRADRLLEEQGLSAVADRQAGALSRGMSQRLSIARAVMHDPRLLLLDEPFTGLDRRSVERLAERLAGLRQDGRTLIIVTHEVREANAIADEAVVLSRGRVIHRAAGAALADGGLEEAARRGMEGAP